MSLFSIGNPALGVLLPLAIYLYIRLNPGIDASIVIPEQHFYIVSGTAIVSVFIGIAVGVVGSRQRNLQVLYVSMAFISLAMLFSVHGLSTPGFLLDQNRLVGVAAQLSVLLMAFWLWLSSLRTDHALNRWLNPITPILLPLWAAPLLVFAVVSLQNPAIVEWVPVDQAPLRAFVALITVGFSAIAAYRYWESYRYSRFPFQLSISYAAGWLAVCQIIISTSETFKLSWWIYHFLLLFCVVLPVIGLIVQYSRGDSLALTVRGLFSIDPAERLQAGISPSVRALIAATEARDPYTAGHSERVAQGSLRLARALHFSPEEMRALAQGGAVHDIGKLQVPDQILNKPGALTPEERKIIEEHTIAGYELCSRLGFMLPELEIVRGHHERIDGNGYPDSLPADKLSNLVRVLSVVDVYDALTTERSYRPAWSKAEAIKYLKENSNAQFDQRYVEAWIELVQDEI